jgi:hypothetical protein
MPRQAREVYSLDERGTKATMLLDPAALKIMPDSPIVKLFVFYCVLFIRTSFASPLAR